MHIWLIQISEPSPIDKQAKKLRTAFLADELAGRGHTVVWWTSAFNHLRKRWYFEADREVSVNDHLSLMVMKGVGYAKNLSLRRLIDHRIISWKFTRAAPRLRKPDIIVCSMPSYDLAFQAVRYAERRNIPILVDIRDQWPDNFLDAVPAGFNHVARLAMVHEFHMLKSLLGRATGLVSMTSGLLEWGVKRGTRKASWQDRVFYLGYRREPEPTKPNPGKIAALAPTIDGGLVVTFLGTFASYHSPGILIEAAERLKNYPIHFVLAGDGQNGPLLKDQAKGLNNVHFPGWLEQDEITALLKLSHVGVCPSGSLKNKLFFPNKAFAYFSEGLCVLTSFEGDIADVIRSLNIGFTYDDVDSLVDAILKLHSDPMLRSTMSNNAREAFGAQFDAQVIYRAYADHIEDVAAGGPRS